MVLWALSLIGAGMGTYFWLAALVAWRRTWWMEWIHLSLTWTLVAGGGLIHLALVWNNRVHSLSGAVYLLMLNGAFFLRPEKHLAGYKLMADWLKFKHPDPDLRYPHPLDLQDPASDESLAPSDGLWVPHAPNPYRDPARLIRMAVFAVILLAIVKFIIDVFL